MKILGLLFLMFVVNSSCSPFVDSPFSDQLLRPERNLNPRSLNKIGDVDADGVIRIAAFSDSHQNYKQLDKALFAINQVEDIDFVVGLGDYTNSGYNLEYDQFIDGIKQLQHPGLMALGNHDAIGAGLELFKKAFGPANFWFESTSHRYIFFNGNNLETPDDFDPSWLKSAVDDSTKPVFIFAHVQLRDTDRYFGSDAAILGSVVEHPKVQLIMNGHNHVYDLLMDNGTVMLQCGRVEADIGDVHWLLIEIQANQICIKRMDTGGSVCETLK